MSRQLNAQQQAAVSVRNSNILVSASAGSGKTTVLIERIGQLILNERVGVDQIMALTFTDNAATEMRQRLAKYLQEALIVSTTKDTKEFIHEQLAKLPDALITTIHSFCLQVVKQYYPVLGLQVQDVNNILTTLECQILQRNALRQVFDNYHGDHRLTMLQLATSGKVGDLESLSKFIIAIAENLRQVGNQSEFVLDQLARYRNLNLFDDQVFAEFMGKWFAKLDMLLPQIDQLLIKGSTAQQENFGMMYQLYQHAASAYRSRNLPEMWQGLRLYLEAKRPGNLKVAKEEVGEVKLLDQLLNPWLYEWDSYQLNQQRIAGQLEFLLELAVNYQAQYRQIKQGVGIDFDDMELYCATILRNPEIASMYAQQLRYVFIDEFQDTSRLQDAIITSICRSDNVFRVGDIKQSIYAFRNARPQIFLDYLKRSDQQVIRLTTNYRSSRQIVEGVNQLFYRLFNIDGMTPLYHSEDFVDAGNRKLQDEPPIKIVFLKEGDELENTEDPSEEAENETSGEDQEEEDLNCIEQKATFIINKIQELVSDPIQPKRYQDIVILVRGAFHNQILDRMFSEAKIPIRISVKANLSKSTKINGVLAALSWVVQPENDVALVTILKNFCGWTEGQLAAMSSRGFDKVWQWLQAHDSQLSHQLEEIRSKTLNASLVDAVELWCDYCQFGLSMITKVEYHNLNLLRTLALDYQTKVDQSLHRYLQFAKDWQSNGDKGEAVIFDHQENVVRVETMHASKGKEYDVVFIWGKNKFTNHDLGKFGCVDSELGISWRGLMDEQSSYHNFIAYDIERKLLQKQREEEIRILYVAMTRAQSQLYYIDTISKTELKCNLDFDFMLTTKSYTQWLQLMQPLIGLSEFVVFEELTPPQSAIKVQTPIIVQPAFTAQYQLTSAKVQPPSFHNQPLVWDDQAATAFGTAKHEAIHLALISNTIPNDPYLLPLFSDSQFQLWLSYPYQSEMDYYQMTEGQIIHGIMDLVVELPDQLLIIDFKTDQVNHVDELVVAYQDQLHQYRSALALSTKKPIATWIYSLKLNQWVLIR